MMIYDAASGALQDIAVRERDVLQAYAAGASAQRGDVAQPSSYAFTLDPLSAAAPPDAYFVVAGDRGRTLFTRDGGFAIRDGALVDGQGRAVLGYRDGNAALAPLRVDPVDAALGLADEARIEDDGSVSYERSVVDPRSGKRVTQRAVAGRLALARFAPGTKLQTVDPQHAAAPPNISAHFGRAGDGNFGPVRPFAREGSGVNIDLGLQRLQEAYLALDAIRAAGVAQRGVEKTAMNLLK